MSRGERRMSRGEHRRADESEGERKMSTGEQMVAESTTWCHTAQLHVWSTHTHGVCAHTRRCTLRQWS